MGLLVGVNWVDAVLLLSLVVGVAVGYAQGVIRQMLGLLALYIGTILGAQYFSLLAQGIRMVLVGVPGRFVNALAFFFIVIAVTAIVNWLVFDAYRSTRINRFPILDHFGGGALGLLSTMVVVGFCLPVIVFATREPTPWAEQARLAVANGMQTSEMVRFFELFKPGLLSLIAPWMPGGLPSIFNL